MIYIKIGAKITDEKYPINFISYMPFDEINGMHKTETELEQEGYLIDSLPAPQVIDGKDAVMYFNPVTKTVFYEYADKLKTPDEAEKETFSNTLATLTLENADLKQQLQTLAATVAQMQLK